MAGGSFTKRGTSYGARPSQCITHRHTPLPVRSSHTGRTPWGSTRRAVRRGPHARATTRQGSPPWAGEGQHQTHSTADQVSARSRRGGRRAVPSKKNPANQPLPHRQPLDNHPISLPPKIQAAPRNLLLATLPRSAYRIGMMTSSWRGGRVAVEHSSARRDRRSGGRDGGGRLWRGAETRKSEGGRPAAVRLGRGEPGLGRGRCLAASRGAVGGDQCRLPPHPISNSGPVDAGAAKGAASSSLTQRGLRGPTVGRL